MKEPKKQGFLKVFTSLASLLASQISNVSPRVELLVSLFAKQKAVFFKHFDADARAVSVGNGYTGV